MMMSERESKEVCKWGPENISKNGKRAIEELIRGRGLTTQLQAIIQKPPLAAAATHDSSSDLVIQILESLNEAISILNTSAQERDQLPKSQDSSESCKTSAEFKPRRGCYKRRRTSETMKKETPNLVEDGHSWRKYGQKFILNAKHPRNYFRCTHKYDQGCEATKQVQKVEDDPPRYVTTYYGRHTCQNLLKSPPQIFLDSPDDHLHLHNDSSILLNFANPFIINSTNNQSCDDGIAPSGPPPPPPAASSSSSSFIPSPSSLKQEIKQESQTLSHYKPSLLLSCDDEECDYLTSFDDGDVISGGVNYSSSNTSPRSCLEMDIMAGVPLDFDDLLHFQF